MSAKAMRRVKIPACGVDPGASVVLSLADGTSVRATNWTSERMVGNANGLLFYDDKWRDWFLVAASTEPASESSSSSSSSLTPNH